MEITELLQEIEQAERNIEYLEERVAVYESLLTGGSSTGFSDMPRSPSPDPARNEKLIIAKMEYEDRLEAEKAKIAGLRKRLSELIFGTLRNVRYADVLKMRYIDGRIWKSIAHDFHMNLDGVYKMKNRALKIIENKRKSDET